MKTSEFNTKNLSESGEVQASLESDEVLSVFLKFLRILREYLISELKKSIGTQDSEKTWEKWYKASLPESKKYLWDDRKKDVGHNSELIDYWNLRDFEKTYHELIRDEFKIDVFKFRESLNPIIKLRNKSAHDYFLSYHDAKNGLEHLKTLANELGANTLANQIEQLLNKNEGQYRPQITTKKEPLDKTGEFLNIYDDYSCNNGQERLIAKNLLQTFISLISRLRRDENLVYRTDLHREFSLESNRRVPVRNLNQKLTAYYPDKKVGIQLDNRNQARVRSHLTFTEIAFQKGLIEECIYMLPMQGDRVSFDQTKREIAQDDPFGTGYFSLEVPIYLIGYD
jgi:hypothetical protein